MKDLGVTMPRTVAQQRNVGQPVDSLKDAQPGDLLVFGSHHIGIYVGNGKMLHAPHTGDHVRISDVYETPTRIRRVLPSGSSSGVTAELSALDSLRPAALRQSTSTGSSGVSGGAIGSTHSSRPPPRSTTCPPACSARSPPSSPASTPTPSVPRVRRA